MNEKDYMANKLALLTRLVEAAEKLAAIGDDVANTLALIEERTGPPTLSDEACKAVELAQQIQDVLAPGTYNDKHVASSKLIEGDLQKDVTKVFNLAGDIQNALARFTDQ